MKPLIIYKSVHQMNTEKVAKAMAEAMGADLRKVEEVKPDTLLKYDLVGFGSGIFYGKHHKSLFNFIESLPHQRKKAFIFSTSGMALKIQHYVLRSAMMKKGFVIKNEFVCPGFETYGVLKLIGGLRKGRPNANDLKNARMFARSLIE